MHDNKITAVDNKIIEADPSRFTVHTQDVGLDSDRYFISRLFINNAVKEDEGEYWCQQQYNEYNQQKTSNLKVTVSISNYLPPLNHPLCSVEPSSMLHDGSDVTFRCLIGDSNPDVKLNLTLEKPDGSSTVIGEPFYTGNTSVETTVTSDDNNALFVCLMTSDTFPSASRRCSTGPITVSDAPVTKSPPDDNEHIIHYGYTGTPITWTSATKNKTSVDNPYLLWSIVGIAAGILLVSAVVIAICILSRRFYSIKTIK